MLAAIALRVYFIVFRHAVFAAGLVALQMSRVISLVLGDKAGAFDRLAAGG